MKRKLKLRKEIKEKLKEYAIIGCLYLVVIVGIIGVNARFAQLNNQTTNNTVITQNN